MLFAVTDIETTGGHASENSITEVAVVITDGVEIKDSFHTLLRPDHPIPFYITTLTGISNEMVEHAPTFSEVADELLAFFEDCVFVAHNAGFDYAFLKKAFEGVGYRFNPQRLCTVRLTRQLFPGLKSYSLGTLCDHFGIDNAARHRATGDTLATVELFHKLVATDSSGIIHGSVKKGSAEQWLPNLLPAAVFQNLPEKPGVYYMLNTSGAILYIGMSTNVKKRIRQHFGGKMSSARRQAFLKEVADIKVELTGSEVLARLIEDAEIRKHWPPHNRAQKRPIRHFAIHRYQDQEGFWRMALHQVKTRKPGELTFSSLSDAKSWLQLFVHQNGLHNELCGLPPDGQDRPEVDIHNALFLSSWSELPAHEPRKIIPLPGRSAREKGFLWMEYGRLRGYGFVDHESSIHHEDELENFLQPLPESELTESILSELMT